MTKTGPKIPASELLGPKASRALEKITSVSLRARIFRAVVICDEALKVADALDLSPYEVLETEAHDLRTWNALAPHVRQLLVAVGQAGARLKELFPLDGVIREDAPDADDFEAALANLVEDAPVTPLRDKREREIDQIVDGTTSTGSAFEGVHQLAEMLQTDFVAFGQRLKNPQVVTDRWLLLAELQELKAKCTHGLEAVVATLVQPFTTEVLSSILPRYIDATERGLVLRATLVDFSYDVGRLNAKLQRCTALQALSVRHALMVRVEEFTCHEAYRYLRPADKRELSKFRIALNAYERSIRDLVGFRETVEGFAKFLEVLRAVNQRDLLVQHDLQRVQTARMLIDAEADEEELWPVVRTLLGRDRLLDELIRAVRRGGALDRDALRRHLDQAQDELSGRW